MFARTIVGPDATDLSPLWGFPFIDSFFLGLAPQAKIYRRSAAFMKEKLSWTRVIQDARSTSPKGQPVVMSSASICVICGSSSGRWVDVSIEPTSQRPGVLM